jgi:potassium-dependent mechanosensitive channel
VRSRQRTRISLVGLLLSALVLLVQCSGAEAQAPPSPRSPAVPSLAPSPDAIPVVEVATRAAQVPALLRRLTGPLAETAENETIRRHLREARARVDFELADAETILRGHPTLDVIQLQQQLWQQRQLQTNEWLSALTRRALLLQDSLNRLGDIKTTWRQTREASVASGAPGAILAQIDGALAAIEAAEAPLATQRTAVFDLQSAVAKEVARSADMLARFTQAQQQAIGGILTRDSPPVWGATAWVNARGTLRGHVRELAVTRWNDIVRYVVDPSNGMPLHVAILAVLIAVFVGARRQARQSSASGSGPVAGISIFDRPYSAALVLTLLFVSAPTSTVPPTLRQLSEVLVLVPVIRLIQTAIDPRLVHPVYALALLFALDSFREAIAGVPVLEQALLALEMVAALAVLIHSLRFGALQRPAVAGAETERLRTLRLGAGFVVLVLAVGLVAGVIGYMRLARLLASGLFGGGALALTLYACLEVIVGLTAVALRVWPLRLLLMVQRHRELLERRTYRIVLWLAVIGWAARVLDYAGLFQPALSFVQTALAARIGRGEISFSAGDVLEFVLTVWLAFVVSAFVRFVLQEDVYPRTQITRGISYAVSSLLNYVILTLGFLLALGAIGLDLTKATVLAGAFGVGIGFGLQSVVNNFVSGLILLFERPIRVGDIVEVGDLQGEVSRIGIRASTVRTYRGADIIVPNAQLVTERVTNWTASDRRRRIDIPVGVDYGSAPEKVVEVLEEVARAHTEILQQPRPQAVFMAFGDSSVNFELRAWTNHIERWTIIQTELAVRVYAAVRAAGMSFPFPQREVRLLHDAADDPPGSAS